MSLINTEIKPFKATAYHNGKFVPVTNDTLKGKWTPGAQTLSPSLDLVGKI